MNVKPIGIIKTPFKEKSGIPIQSKFGQDFKGVIEVFSEYVEGLKDLENFSHVYLIYQFHQSLDFNLLVKPYRSEEVKGVFATRAPKRPNPIGLSIVKIEKIEKNFITFSGVDMLDQTPLLDIKPYFREFDDFSLETKSGWLDSSDTNTKISDDRF